MSKNLYLILILFSLLLVKGYGQLCDTCTGIITFTVDLSNNPDSVWHSPSVKREGVCCGSSDPPYIRFIITTHPSTDLLNFRLISGAIPPSFEYQVDCGVPQSISEPLCVVGTGPYCVVFCKSGGNANEYEIAASHTVDASDNITVSNGCSAEISVSGLNESTVVWNTISPGTYGQYNYMLSDTAGEDTIFVTPVFPYPDSMDIEVTGNLATYCTTINTRDTVRVYFVNEKFASITPANPAICKGESSVTLEATITGGRPPYHYLWSTGETTQTISVNTATSFWVQMTDSTNCPPVFDTVTVIEHVSYIEAIAGADEYVCASGPTVQFNGSVVQATGGYWSGGSGVFLPDSATLTAQYVPTAAEITAGTVGLILTTTGNGSCNADTDTMLLTINQLPIVNAGVDVDECSDATAITLNGSVTGAVTSGVWKTKGSGYFSDSLNLLTDYHPSAADIANGSVKLILRSKNDTVCNVVSDTMILAFIQQPLVQAGLDTTVCKTLPTLKLNGTVTGPHVKKWWKSINGSGFFDDSTKTDAIYSITAADILKPSISFVLNATNDVSCNPVRDTFILSFLPEPVSNAGTDQTVCANNNITSLNGTASNYTTVYWTSSGTGGFLPNSLLLNTVYIPSTADNTVGSVTITLNAVNACASATDNLKITITPAPLVNAGADQTICASDPGATLAGSVTLGAITGEWTTSGTGYFSPNNKNLSATYVQSAADTVAGSVEMTLTSTNNGNCNAVSDVMNITILRSPLVDIGGDDTICNNAKATLTANIIGGSGLGIWTTPDGKGTFSPNIESNPAIYTPKAEDIAKGNITFVFTTTNNASCPPAYDSKKIYIVPPPVVDAGSNKTACANSSPVSVSGTMSGGASKGVWRTQGGGRFSDSTLLSTQYYQSSSDTAKGSVKLYLVSTGGCQEIKDSMLITFSPAPKVNAGADQYLCKGVMSVNLSGQVSGITSTGQWQTLGSGTFSPSATSLITTYNLSTADTAGSLVKLILSSTNNLTCAPSTDTVNVYLTTVPTVSAGVGTTICGNDSASLNGIITNGSGLGIWTTSGDGFFVPADTLLNATYVPGVVDTANGSVLLTLTSRKACVNPSASVTITIQDAPVSYAGQDTILCEGTTNLQLNGSVTAWAQPGKWTSSGTGIFNPSENSLNAVYQSSLADIDSGSVILVLESLNNGICNAARDTMVVRYIKSPVLDAGTNFTTCVNNNASLSASLAGGSGKVKWTTNGNGYFSPSDSSLFTGYYSDINDTGMAVKIYVETTDMAQCPSVKDSLELTVIKSPKAYAGVDNYSCSNNPGVSLSGSVTNALGGKWTAAGGGVFANDTILNTTFTPSATDIANGTTVVYLSTTGNGVCSSNIDSMVLTIKKAPLVNAGSDKYVCEGTSLVNLSGSVSGLTSTGKWASNGNGSFSNQFSMSTNYTLGSKDTVSTRLILESTNNDKCLAVRDTSYIYVTKVPTVNAGINDSICKNNARVTLSGSIVGEYPSGLWIPLNGTGTFNPSDTVMNAEYVASTADLNKTSIDIVLMATKACVPVKDTVRLTITPAPVVDAGSDIIVCEGVSSVNIIGTVSSGATKGVWKTKGSGTFSDTASLNTAYNPSPADSASGKVMLLLTSTDNGDCNPVSDTMIIYFGKKPTPGMLMSADTVCMYQEVTFTDNSSIINDTLGSWQWVFDVKTVNGSTATNHWGSSGWQDVKLIVKSVKGCTDSVSDQVYVRPAPVANYGYTPGCESDVAIFLNSSVNGNTYYWDFGNGNSSTETSPPPQTYDSVGLYTSYLITTDAYSCKDTLIVPVKIRHSPLASFTFSLLCEGKTAKFTDKSIVLNDTIESWYWDFGDGSTSTLQNPTHVFNSSDTTLIRLVVATSHCTDTYDLHKAPFPKLILNPSPDKGCSPLKTVFYSNGTSESLYTWDFGDGMMSTEQIPSHIYFNATGTAKEYIVKVIAESSYGCIDSTWDTIMIYPDPEPVFTTNPASACSKKEVQFINASVNSVSYSWNWGDGTTGDTAANPSHTFTNSGSSIVYYPVQLTSVSSDGCKDSTINYIAIYPIPVFTISVNPAIVCHLDNIVFTATTGGKSYYWDYGDGSPPEYGSNLTYHKFENYTNQNDTVTIQLIYTSTLNCTDTTYKDVVVYPNPNPSYDLDTLDGCTPFTIKTTNTSPAAASYRWNFGDNTYDTTVLASESLTHQYINNTDFQKAYIVKLEAVSDKGCVSEFSRTINVFPRIVAAYIQNKTEGCTPLNVTYTDKSINATSYYWTFSDGGVSTNKNPLHTYLNSGDLDSVYTAQLIVRSDFNCYDTSTVSTALVHPKPDGFFTLESSAGCSEFMAIVTDESQRAINRKWYFSNGDSLTNNETYFEKGFVNRTLSVAEYTLTLITKSIYGCYDTTTEKVSVYPEIKADFSVSSTAGCTPQNIGFTVLSQGTKYYSWTFGDGSTSTANNPVHKYVNLSDSTMHFLAKLTTYSDYLCEDDTTIVITLYPQPKATFSLTKNSGCSPHNAVLVDSTVNASLYYWNYGNGDVKVTSAFVSDYLFENSTTSPQKYNIILIVESADKCYDTVTQDVTIYPEVSASFMHNSNGCHPFDVDFVNTSDVVVSYEWDFGDGGLSGLINPAHTFSNSGFADKEYLIILKATSNYGCFDTAMSKVTVHPMPDADFTVDPSYVELPNAVVYFDNTTEGNIWNHEWDFNDGQTSAEQEPGSHKYSTWGDYIIQLIVYSDYCRDTITHQIKVVPGTPIADYDSSYEGCAPLTVSFYNKSQGADFYKWEFGDGGSSDDENPTYTFYKPGVYTVVLAAKTPFQAAYSSKHTVTVYPQPFVFFQYSAIYVEIGVEPVLFYNQSDNGSYYYWDFGDGYTSTDVSPSHTYMTEGTYSVKLIVYSSEMCVDSFTVENALRAEDFCVLKMPSAFTPSQDGPSGGKYDPTEQEVSNDVFHPLYKRIEEYSLEIYNRWGELLFVSKDKDIGWDGYFNGEPAKQDVYVYKVKGVCISGRVIEETGTVTLIR